MTRRSPTVGMDDPAIRNWLRNHYAERRAVYRINGYLTVIDETKDKGELWRAVVDACSQEEAPKE